MEIALVIAQIVLGSAIGESVCEFLVAPLFDWLVKRFKLDPDVKGILLRSVSAEVGVGIALEYSLSIPALLGMHSVHEWVGMVLTGLLLGRGSNWVHEFIKRLVMANVTAQAEATTAVAEAKAARRADDVAERAAGRG